jgi:hypothetical protein
MYDAVVKGPQRQCATNALFMQRWADIESTSTVEGYNGLVHDYINTMIFRASSDDVPVDLASREPPTGDPKTESK